MKFYGSGIVWNPEKRKRLCEFCKSAGTFETDDKYTIEMLVKLGYKHDEEAIEVENTEIVESELSLKDMSINQLRKAAKLAGFRNCNTKSKNALIELLEGE